MPDSHPADYRPLTEAERLESAFATLADIFREEADLPKTSERLAMLAHLLTALGGLLAILQPVAQTAEASR